jgi:hypothetical protein
VPEFGTDSDVIGRREQILQAAQKLLAVKGFRETNLTFSLPLRRTSAPACEINRPRA